MKTIDRYKIIVLVHCGVYLCCVEYTNNLSHLIIWLHKRICLADIQHKMKIKKTTVLSAHDFIIVEEECKQSLWYHRLRWQQRLKTDYKV